MNTWKKICLVIGSMVLTQSMFIHTSVAQTKSATNSQSKSSAAPSKYFVVQNIATEKMRVYERCTETPNCPHRMIMESEMVVGRTSSKGKQGQVFLTRTGFFKITKWVKFYEDVASHYPSWYDPKYPAMPYNASSTDWMSDRYLPNPKQNVYRGSFGWYAAMVAPNADYQWIHGTHGWGHDQDRYIQLTRSLFLNIFSDPRSAGCTRLENQAVAWLRHVAEPGTEVFRVYALEAYADPKLSRYKDQAQPVNWDWILTGTGVRMENAASADKQTVEKLMARGLVKNSDVLETGTYKVKQYPNGLGFTPTLFGLGSSQGTTGDTYTIGRKGFKGVFLVDEGRFVNYAHPEDVPKGGTGAPLPSYAVAKVDYVLAEPHKSPNSNDKDANPWGGIASTQPHDLNTFMAGVTDSGLSTVAKPSAALDRNLSVSGAKQRLNGSLNFKNLDFEVPENLKTVIDEREYNELIETLQNRKLERAGFNN